MNGQFTVGEKVLIDVAVLDCGGNAVKKEVEGEVAYLREKSRLSVWVKYNHPGVRYQQFTHEFHVSAVRKQPPPAPPVKGYEILEFLREPCHGTGYVSYILVGGELYNAFEDIRGFTGVSYKLDEILSWLTDGAAKLLIKSVRILSDNRVLTLGDSTELGVIESFFTNPYGIMVASLDGKTTFPVIHLYKKEPPIPQPLFTTHDGVNIFPEMPFFRVDKNFNASIYFAARYGDYPLGFTQTTFSTEQAAQQYVVENKPQFSMKEILSICEQMNYSTLWFGEKLMESAKSKHKQ